MNPLLNVFITVMAPIFLVAGVGYLVARLGIITDPRALSRASLYVFLPALTFKAMLKTQLGATEFIALFLFAWIMAGAQGLLGRTIARALTFDQLEEGGFLLSIITVNAGNYGIPLNQFAFGPHSLEPATVYYVATLIVTYTGGVFVATRGSRNIRGSLGQVLKMPIVYATFIGLMANRLGWGLPDVVSRPIDLLSGAAVPTMLILLGVELGRTRVGHDPLPIGLAAGMKLIAAPALGFGLASLMGLQGLTRTVAIVQSSMPTAVGAALLSVEFGARPSLVSSVVLVTTLLSLATLTILVTILR